MARDYTKYSVEGLGDKLNKRQLVFTIVKDWISKNNPSLEDIQAAFPDHIQGSNGFIVLESEVKNAKHFNVKNPLDINNGMSVVVSNQWGENISGFIEHVQSMNYNVSSNKNKSSDSNSQNINANTTLVELDAIIEKIVHDDKTAQEKFAPSTINFINENNQYYWFILAVNNFLRDLEIKIDDDGLDLSVDGLHPKGRNLNFNPYEDYRLFYDWREEKFSTEEDDDEPTSFFTALIDSFYDFDAHSDLISLSEDALNVFINLSKTVLLCTICKECENGADSDDLTNLLLNINFDDLPQIKDEIGGGDIANEILNDVLVALGIEIDEYQNEEDLWRDIYLMNYEDVARALLDDDVFDLDYIRS